MYSARILLCLKSFFLSLILVIASGRVFAESEYENACRIKAKEIAAENYRQCLTERRGAHVEQIKKDYQEKLNSLKEEYEKEIGKLGGKVSNGKKTDKKLALGKKSKKKTARSEDTNSAPVDFTNSSTGSDDSTMDIPEPIPVETVPNESSL